MHIYAIILVPKNAIPSNEDDEIRRLMLEEVIDKIMAPLHYDHKAVFTDGGWSNPNAQFDYWGWWLDEGMLREPKEFIGKPWSAVITPDSVWHERRGLWKGETETDDE